MNVISALGFRSIRGYQTRARGIRGYQTRAGPVFGYNPSQWLDVDRPEVPEEVLGARVDQSNAFRYVEAFRRHGHKYAALDPVSPTRPPLGPELDPARYGLSSDQHVSSLGLLSSPPAQLTVGDLTSALTNLYCGPVTIETGAVEGEGEQEWLHSRYEQLLLSDLETQEKKNLAGDMLRSQAFDQFLATKFQSVKRYGGEGAEAMMGFFTSLFQCAGEQGVSHIVLGQAHRGRLNLLTGLLGFPPVAMFRKMRGLPEFPPEQLGAGDVLSHLTASLEVGEGVRVTLLPNPSHLEAVNPVACGKARARHLTSRSGDYDDISGKRMGDGVLCVQVHGDAALAGQGINMETLQLANLPHYSVGGSLHLVVNNQVGFTTPADRARSSPHCTGLASQIGAPVIHVNGDHPENLVRATRLAMEYRDKFRKDVFVDLVCFRRWGHNELDDPTFTNPALYSIIHARRSVPDMYLEKLVEEGVMDESQATTLVDSHVEMLNKNLQEIDSYKPERTNLKGLWGDMVEPSPTLSDWDTGLSPDLLRFVGARSVFSPEGFNVHPHLRKHHVEGRLRKLEAGAGLDWGTCEALAFGSLLYQGYNVRISGQDVGRATFSHRHAMLVDQKTNENFIPFNQMSAEQTGKLEVANSTLSEEAVMAFEYGMSVESPKNLIVWEAQFGDFFNGAQIILDTYVANGESKWGLQSGLVVLLPHGMDGAGPEHSSCRMERFLQMSDSKETECDTDQVNWEVVHPTTSAQYYHLLRRQMLRNYRKPLVVVAPKTLLRLPQASSLLSELGPGTSFQPVLPDPGVTEPSKVETVVFVSGKHYYTLAKALQDRGEGGKVALVRLESLCPFPAGQLQAEVARFSSARRWVWSQEEHRNQGAWGHVGPRFEQLVGVKLEYAGRGELCQPAVGVGKVHQVEAEEVVRQTFQGR